MPGPHILMALISPSFAVGQAVVHSPGARLIGGDGCQIGVPAASSVAVYVKEVEGQVVAFKNELAAGLIMTTARRMRSPAIAFELTSLSERGESDNYQKS